MALLKVVTILASLTICALAVEETDSYQQPPTQYDDQTQEGAPQVPLYLQLPNTDDPIPFNSYLVPSTDLRAPDNDSPYQGEFYPVPSQDLQVPSAEDWNPSNDPALLYELPSEYTKEVVPTNLHPKKYDKFVFEKVKPNAGKPKEEVVLVPIKVQDYINKQKQQDKTIRNYEKQANQKLLNAEKVKPTQKPKIHANHKYRDEKEPVHAASAFDSQAQTTNGHLDSVALGNHHNAGGERVEFQMHGYDGPKSYKWGYDTGKGHNRQFRYEESNNDGYIKGHYGYYDKHGKLQMVHYDSHPQDGFHAEGNFGQ